jgi:RNA 2',3'-cyclic 3'-phosphodiesterase
VNLPGTVDGDERIRLFCALRLPDETVGRFVEWQALAFAGVDDVRLVPEGNLHLTLAFLGHRPRSEVEGIAAELRAAAAGTEAIRLSVRRYRETRSVAMVTFDDEGGAAGRLAADLHGRLQRLGVYRPEARPWLPHLTVLRFRRPPRLRPELPAVPPFSPSDAALYHSVLRSGGAQYDVIQAVPLARS